MQETDFMSAVNVLLREADNLKQTLESGHVSFKYVNRVTCTHKHSHTHCP